MSKKRVLVIHGPNLNMLGERETKIYGKTTLNEINKNLKKIAKKNNLNLAIFFSNIEGEIITELQENRNKIDALIVNLAGYTHTSIAIRDALKLIPVPIVEVHLSNIFAREKFRKTSLISDIATGVITGLGETGYYFALEYIAGQLKQFRG